VGEGGSQIGPSRLIIQRMIQAIWENANTMMLLKLFNKMFCIQFKNFISLSNSFVSEVTSNSVEEVPVMAS
jgi:hypothetical protein